MDHAIGTDPSLVPGLGSHQVCLPQKGHAGGDELVEALEGEGGLRFMVDEEGLVQGAVAAEGGEDVAQATFGGEAALLEAKAPELPLLESMLNV